MKNETLFTSLVCTGAGPVHFYFLCVPGPGRRGTVDADRRPPRDETCL
jgi:hypothetical protein